MRAINRSLLTIAMLCVATITAAQNYRPTSSGEVVEHQNYTLSYIEEHEQAEWVYYTLTPQMTTGASERSNSFRIDPKVSSKSASSSDYTKSGYDRGHLCPAADMSHNEVAMRESFYMSNMSPQLPALNRGGWKVLEERVRQWVVSCDTLHVVVGPILDSDTPLKRIGANGVSVPTHFYKIVYSPRDSKMAAFIMPNEKIANPIESYAVSVDEIESRTDIDFFAALDDKIESRLEAERSHNPRR